MQKKCNKTLLSLILSMMLIVAMAFNMTACGDNNAEKPNTEGQSQVAGTEQDPRPGSVENGTKEETTVLGEGAAVFDFVVVDKDGIKTKFEIHTDKTTVGEALIEVKLIEGEAGPYGLYVKTVAGTTLDYDRDGMYWSFYINDEYAMTGVDVTEIKEGETYSFKAEKS